MNSTATFSPSPTTTQTPQATHDVCHPPSASLPSDTLGYSLYMFAWILTIMFTIYASYLAVTHIVSHLKYYYAPQYQRFIVRIILLIPIYSVVSSIEFRFVNGSVYWDVVRDCYEGFVLYSFYSLLLHYIGNDPATQRQRLAESCQSEEQVSMPMPLCCVGYSIKNPKFLDNCKFFVLQYAALRPLTSLFAVLLQWMGRLCPNSLSPATASFWLGLINFTSASVALYALVLFYTAAYPLLAPHHPFYKFVAVKFIIFFSYWQSIVLSLFIHIGLIRDGDGMSAADVSSAVQSFLVCFEMIVAAGLHRRAFPVSECLPNQSTDAHPVQETEHDFKSMMKTMLNDSVHPLSEDITFPTTDMSYGIRDALTFKDLVRDIGETPDMAMDVVSNSFDPKRGHRSMPSINLDRLNPFRSSFDTVDQTIFPNQERYGSDFIDLEKEDDEVWGVDTSRDASRVRIGGGYQNLNMFGMTRAESSEQLP